MNKRIKELAADAGYPDYMTYGQDKVLERFAELIVSECCYKLEEMGESWHEFAKNPPDGQEHNASGALFAAYRLKEDAVDEIKEHFGVEE
jgi:hypothetical protein